MWVCGSGPGYGKPGQRERTCLQIDEEGRPWRQFSVDCSFTAVAKVGSDAEMTDLSFVDVFLFKMEWTWAGGKKQNQCSNFKSSQGPTYQCFPIVTWTWVLLKEIFPVTVHNFFFFLLFLLSNIRKYLRCLGSKTRNLCTHHPDWANVKVYLLQIF